jgi:hypothetical protein
MKTINFSKRPSSRKKILFKTRFIWVSDFVFGMGIIGKANGISGAVFRSDLGHLVIY